MLEPRHRSQEADYFQSRIFKDNARASDAFLKLVTRTTENSGGSINQHELQTLSPSTELQKKPFDYQKELIRHAVAALQQGRRRQMLSMPTGAGKTATAIWLLHEFILHNGVYRVLWLAPSKELVTQAADAFKASWNHPLPEAVLEVHGLSVIPQNENSVVIIVTTIQQLLHRHAEVELFSPQVVIFDEAHQAAAPRFRQALEHAIESSSAILLGLSATPGRQIASEINDLSNMFDEHLAVPELLGPSPIDYLRSIGVYASIGLKQIALDEEFAYLSVRGDAQNLPVTDLCSHPGRFWPTVQTIAGAAKNGPVLVFASSVVHCHALQVALAMNKTISRTLSYRTTPKARADIIHRFKSGMLPVLLNVAILNTGFDFPGLSQVVVTAPVRSSVLWEQIVGRAARGPKVGGTETSEVYQVDRHDLIHGQLQSYSRFWGGHWN